MTSRRLTSVMYELMVSNFKAIDNKKTSTRHSVYTKKKINNENIRVFSKHKRK